MENMVAMALSDYDALKEQVRRYEQKLADKQREIDDIKIFDFEVSYDGTLKAILNEDAQQFLDKALAEYGDEYIAKKGLRDFSVWTYAIPRPVEVVATEIEDISEETEF